MKNWVKLEKLRKEKKNEKRKKAKREKKMKREKKSEKRKKRWKEKKKGEKRKICFLSKFMERFSKLLKIDRKTNQKKINKCINGIIKNNIK